MGNKNSGSNYPKNRNQRDDTYRYNTPKYYQHNRSLNTGSQAFDSDEDARGFNDTLNTQYDDLNTGKYENYSPDGYYGSNYGSVNSRGGRDYEQNAGYRDSYNRLTTGQWPEIEDANRNRAQHGPHRGKGPKNYKRTDARVKEDINDRLVEDNYIDASDVDISVENGEVTITGTVETREIKRRIEDIIENVSGVTHYENRVRVKVPGNRSANIQNSK